MTSRLSALIIWAAVAASLAYWGLRWFSQPIAVPDITTSVSMDSGAKGDFKRLLTGPATQHDVAVIDMGAQTALAARLQLQGAFAAPERQSQQGVALLSLDGQPARAIRVGQVIDGDLTLLSVDKRGAHIGLNSGTVLLTLPLPTLPMAATATLPAPTGVSTVLPPQPSAAEQTDHSNAPEAEARESVS